MKLAELFNENKSILRNRLKGFHYPEHEVEIENIIDSFFNEISHSSSEIMEWFALKFELIRPAILNLLQIQKLVFAKTLTKNEPPTSLTIQFSNQLERFDDVFIVIAKNAIYGYDEWYKDNPSDLSRLRISEFLEIIYQLCDSIDQLVEYYEAQSKRLLHTYENLTSIISRRVNKESNRDLQRKIGRKIYREGYKLATGKEFDPDMYDSDLLNGAPEEAYDQILERYSDIYQQLLKKDGISVIEYSDKDKPLFDVILSDEVSKITPVYPAFTTEGELYLKGLVYIPKTGEK